jgi:hypothetical protein
MIRDIYPGSKIRQFFTDPGIKKAMDSVLESATLAMYIKTIRCKKIFCGMEPGAFSATYVPGTGTTTSLASH